MIKPMLISQLLRKVESLLETDEEFGTHYDVDRKVMCVTYQGCTYISPVVIHMTDSEYAYFRDAMCELLPEPEREKGRFW